MSLHDRVKEARRAVQQAAIERWQEREGERNRSRAIIAASGPGAADSPERQAQYRRRGARMELARSLSRTGQLPLGIERRMGATLDYGPYAPSDGARKAGKPVARLVDGIGPGMVPEGIATGFLIGQGLLMTNYHVFPSSIDARNVGANFMFEKSENGVQAGVVFELNPDRFFISDKKLDLAITAVNPKSITGEPLETFGAITLIKATSKILKGQPINIIQHPEGGPKQYAVSQNRLIDILDSFLHYETDTLQGSSGAPAFSAEWELVALHHAGVPEIRNGRVIAADGSYWVEEMGDERVRWVANEGTRVSTIVAHLSGLAPATAEERDILKRLLVETGDPLEELSVPANPAGQEMLSPPGQQQPQAIVAGGGSMSNQFVFHGPVTIHISGGAPTILPAPGTVSQPAATGPAPGGPAAGLEAVIRFDPNYKARKGYDPAFLDPDGDIRVPTPKIADSRLPEIYKRSGRPLVLKYHHFELVMNKARRLQMWSAVNVDYDPTKKWDGDRKSFGSDKWILDPRIPAEIQIVDSEFYKPAGNIDRGHIVRREDNAWGNTERQIEYANSDTFHWTNCTPQHEAFNQSTPGKNDKTYRGMEGLWGGFENHVQKSRKGDDTKCCVLAGPILDKNDPEVDFGSGEIKYPLRFWKVVCIADPLEEGGAPVLQVYGFLLDQTEVVEQFGIEAFRPGRFEKYRKPLSEIAKAAGIVFDDILLAAEVTTDR